MTQPAKHTPGPLHNVTGHMPGPWVRQVLNDESEAYIHDKHCNAIARVYSLSDAALIAAAPAMYEALTIALQIMIDKRVPYQHEIDQARAALAQVDGKQ